MFFHHIRKHQVQTGIKEQQMRYTRILHLSKDMIRSMLLFYQETRSASRTIVISYASTRRKMQNFLLLLWKSHGSASP